MSSETFPEKPKTIDFFIFNPIPPGGGSTPRFSQHYLEKIFYLNLVTFLIEKWVSVYTVKLEDGPFPVAMATAQIKGSRMTFLKSFLDFDLKMKSATIN